LNARGVPPPSPATRDSFRKKLRARANSHDQGNRERDGPSSGSGMDDVRNLGMPGDSCSGAISIGDIFGHKGRTAQDPQPVRESRTRSSSTRSPTSSANSDQAGEGSDKRGSRQRHVFSTRSRQKILARIQPRRGLARAYAALRWERPPIHKAHLVPPQDRAPVQVLRGLCIFFL